MKLYKNYIRVDSQNRVIYGFSSAFITPSEGDICIGETNEFDFSLFGVIKPDLFVRNYKISKYAWNPETREVYERPKEEINAEIDAIKAKEDQERQIEYYKNQLNASDYKILKFAEKVILCANESEIMELISSEFSNLREDIGKRRIWRSAINSIEEEMTKDE